MFSLFCFNVLLGVGREGQLFGGQEGRVLRLLLLLLLFVMGGRACVRARMCEHAFPMCVYTVTMCVRIVNAKSELFSSVCVCVCVCV